MINMINLKKYLILLVDQNINNIKKMQKINKISNYNNY